MFYNKVGACDFINRQWATGAPFSYLPKICCGFAVSKVTVMVLGKYSFVLDKLGFTLPVV